METKDIIYNKKVFDIYIPIGSVCRPAKQLLINDLRKEAYPLDWQIVPHIDTVLHLFETRFEDFFTDIVEIDPAPESTNRSIEDVKNDITSIHHFPKNMEVEVVHKEFLSKMRRRFERLEKRLMSEKSCILIGNRTDSIETIKAFLEDFSNLYPHLRIELLNVRSDKKMDSAHMEKEEIQLNEKLSIIEYRLNDFIDSHTGERYGWKGNCVLWKKILDDYSTMDEVQKIEKYKKIEKPYVIYGAGKMCIRTLDKLKKFEIEVKGIAVSDTSNNPNNIEGKKVTAIEEYEKDDPIIVALKDQDEAKKIIGILKNKGYFNIFDMPFNIV